MNRVWITVPYHGASQDRPARMAYFKGPNGALDLRCLRTDGTVSIGGDGPPYCFPNEEAAVLAIENYEAAQKAPE